MATRTLELEFPLRGLDRRLAHPKQRPFTTPSIVNVRPEGPFEKRLRGGSRPGLVKSFAETAAELPLADGEGNPVRLLTIMRSLNAEGRVTFTEPFNDDPMNPTNWDAPSWVSMSGGWFDTYFRPGEGAAHSTGSRGAILTTTAMALVRTTADYTAEVKLLDGIITGDNPDVGLLPHLNPGDYVNYKIFARLNATNPSNLSSVSAVLNHRRADNGDYSALLGIRRDDQYTLAGVELYNGQLAAPGYLSLTITPGKIASATWRSSSFTKSVTASFSGYGDPDGHRIALEVDAELSTLAGVSYRVDDFALRYMSTAGGVPPEAVVAAAKNDSGTVKLYRETTEGSLVEVGTQTADLADETLQAVDYLGKLYIADFSDNRTQQTDGSSAGVVNGVLDDSDVSDWTALSISTTTDMVELTGGASGAGEFSGKTGGVYGINTIHATDGLKLKKLSTGAALAGGDDLATPEYRVLRGPKMYDSDTDTLDLYPADDVPVGCRIIEIFNERIAWGGDPENHGQWWMSRFRDPLDYNFGVSATDRARAISSHASYTDSDAGGLATPMTALVALTEDYWLLSSATELYLARGDPGAGGITGNVSRQIGIGSRTAWCRLPDGSIIFLSRDGLYRFHPSHPLPENISREKLPLDLLDVVQNTDMIVTLEYDVLFRGVHINVTPSTAGPTTHYWFDWTTQAFCTNVFGQTDHEPFSITYDAKVNRVLLGGRDGWIRHYSAAATDDDGNAVVKHVDYGPIPLNHGRAGIAESVKIVLDDGSDDVTWTFRTGLSAEEAYTAAPRASGVAFAGINRRQGVRLFGHYGFLRVSTTGAVRWAIDSITLRVLPLPAEGRVM